MDPWSTKNWLRFGAYVVVATILATLRLSGLQNDTLKSFVCFYAGCFYGAGIMGYWHKIVGWKWYGGLGMGLSLVETIVFMIDPGGKVVP